VNTRFLNVNLELVATTDVQPLLAHLEASTIELRNSVDDGNQTVWLELDADPSDPDEAIRGFAALIESLPDHLREQWAGCDDRCLNIGIERGLTPHASAFGISSETLVRIAGLTARLEITVYSPEPGK
jgi:hypothetical protein